MTDKDFALIQKSAEETLKMPDKLREVIEKNNLLPSEINKWTKIWSKQYYIVQCLKIDLEKLYGELFKHYKFNDSCAWGSTKEIETQIHSDDSYKAKILEYTTQKYYLDFVTETLSSVKNLNFVIKNFIDYKKIETTNF